MTAAEIRPERLYLMPIGWTTLQTPNGPLDLVAGCYLIRMSDGANILVDSGLPPDAEPSPHLSQLSDGKTVLEHLADIDLRPDDIGAVVCTHLDVDHAGHHDAFRNAEFVVQRAHLDVARDDPRYDGARANWDHPDLRYRPVDGDVELAPGVWLIETSGHTPGHQSVLVRLAKTGPVLLAIDAVPAQALFTPDRPATPMDVDGELARVSARKLIDLAKRERAALVVFGHDGAQWKTLKRAPEFYD
jgi:N-acyl homoserine lactone hydrolase